MMKKSIAASMTKGIGILHTTCMANSCQGKFAGALFWLNYSIYKNAQALDVVQVTDVMNTC